MKIALKEKAPLVSATNHWGQMFMGVLTELMYGMFEILLCIIIISEGLESNKNNANF